MDQAAPEALRVPDCPHALVRQEVRLDPVLRQVPRVPAVRVRLPVLQLPLTRARLGLPEALEILVVQEG